MLGLFLLFLLAFIFFSLITHFYFSLLENDLRWIAASKTLVASENIVRFATFELRAIPLYHSPYDIHPFRALFSALRSHRALILENLARLSFRTLRGSHRGSRKYFSN